MGVKKRPAPRCTSHWEQRTSLSSLAEIFFIVAVVAKLLHIVKQLFETF